MTYYKRGGYYYRHINTVEFLGRRDAVCHVVTDLDAPDVRTIPFDSLNTREPATAEEWEAAEKRAAARVRKEEERDQMQRDALAYGLHVAAKCGFRGDQTYWPVIVRVTATRYVDWTGGQWIRTGAEYKIGRQVGSSSSALTADSIARVEAACNGAKRFDFIAEGRRLAGKTEVEP